MTDYYTVQDLYDIRHDAQAKVKKGYSNDEAIKKAKDMKASGKKHKGARLERTIVKELKRSGLVKNAKRSFQSGAHWSWKSDIYAPGLNFSIEAKNQERINIWKWWEQADSQRKAYSPPVLMFTSNYRPILTVMELQDWINLVLENKELNEEIKKLKEDD